MINVDLITPLEMYPTVFEVADLHIMKGSTFVLSGGLHSPIVFPFMCNTAE